MLYAIKSFFLKKLYRLLIYDVIILPKKDIPIYNKLHTYLQLKIDSNKGFFIFNFKEDRRRSQRKIDLLIKHFIVELEIPNNLTVKNNDIVDKVLVAIKIVIFPINYTILSELLIELYLDSFLKRYL